MEVSVDIAPQPMQSALDSFASQTGLQFIYPTQGLSTGLMSPRLSGKYPIDTALTRLLSPNGLTYTFVNPKTITIRAMRPDEQEASLTQAQASVGKEPEDLGVITVTGTNLSNFDPASPILILDSEQIQRRGYSSIEDVLRSLPQNLASRTSTAAAMGEKEYGQKYVSMSQVGNTAINLRGMGSASTLVLINGRRPAASAQGEGRFTDISSIPLSQVDYIEVLTDGASAIYGADAVAGVVNIVLKKNYSGTTLQLRREVSSTGANVSMANLGHTFGWGSGTLTAMASFERTDPADILKLIRSGPMGVGDFTADGGANTRLADFASPGAVYRVRYNRRDRLYDVLSPMLGYIPMNQDGTSLRPADLIRPGAEPTRSSYPMPSLGPRTDRKALRLQGQQNFGAKMELDFGLGYTQQINKEFWHPQIRDFVTFQNNRRSLTYVPADNPNNPFGRDVAVGYSYAAEMAGMQFSNNQRQDNIDAHIGIRGKPSWMGGWHLETSLAYSGEAGRADLLNDPGLSSDTPAQRARLAAVYKSINPFGNGSNAAVVAANRRLLESLVVRQQNMFSSRALSWDGMVRGDLFSMPAGKAELAMGLQFRTEKNRSAYSVVNNPKPAVVSKSTRDSSAAFLEAGFPLLKDQPFAKELTITVAARYERFRQSGNSAVLLSSLLEDPTDPDAPLVNVLELGGFSVPAITGGAVAGPQDETGPSVRLRRAYSNVSPLARLSWRPFDDLRLRATWGKSFVTPVGPQLFGQLTFQVEDATLVDQGVKLPAGTHVLRVDGPNSQLNPQVATTQTYGFDYSPRFVPGLSLSMTYNHIRYKNYIGSIGDLMTPFQIFDAAAKLPPGVLVQGQNNVVLWDTRDRNFLGRTSRSVDVSANYVIPGSWGDWRFDLNLTRTLELSVRTLPGMPKIVLSDTELGPTKWAGDFQVGWDKGDFNVTLGAHYISGFRVIDQLSARGGIFNPNDPPNPNPRTSAGESITFDTQIGYRPQSSNAWLRGLSFQLGAKNVFNRALPFVDNGFGFVSSRGGVRGRVVYVDLQKEF